MALLDGALKGVMDGLAENPVVKDAMAKFEQLAQGVIHAMNHFNQRFDTLESKANRTLDDSHSIHNKCDQILFMLRHPSDVTPAGDDGLMGLLAENGEEMIIQDFDSGDVPLGTSHTFDGSQPIIRVHESEVH